MGKFAVVQAEGGGYNSNMSSSSREEWLSMLQCCEKLRRQLPAVEHPLINQIGEQADATERTQFVDEICVVTGFAVSSRYAPLQK